MSSGSGPDGSPNEVVATVLAGETYRGTAFVVNAWYATAYEPIVDTAGEVVSVLYVGVPQENVDSLRTAITTTRVGETGEVTILGGSGAGRGEVNLLPLNATVEAARAGQAGQVFAVVAGEVKDLATQTRDATDRISERIGAIQARTDTAVGAIEGIVEVVERIADLQTAIAGAVEEQTATSVEISRSLGGAATGVAEISISVVGAAAAADQTGGAARETRAAAAELTELAQELRSLVGSAGTGKESAGAGARTPSAKAAGSPAGDDLAAPDPDRTPAFH